MKLSLLPASSIVTGAVFNRNPSDVRRRAEDGPVVVTDHGRPSHVILSVADFERHYHRPLSAGEALDDSNALIDLDFTVDRATLEEREIEF